MQKLILHFFTSWTINCAWYWVLIVQPFQLIDVWDHLQFCVCSRAGPRISPVQTQWGETTVDRWVMDRDEEVVAEVALGRGPDWWGSAWASDSWGIPFVRRGGAEAELAQALETTPSTGSFLICSSCPQFPIRHRCKGWKKAASGAVSWDKANRWSQGLALPVLLKGY